MWVVELKREIYVIIIFFIGKKCILMIRSKFCDN